MEKFDDHCAYDWLCRFGTLPILSFVLASEVERIAVFLWPDFRCAAVYFYPSISKHELQSSFKSIVILVAAAGSFMTLHSLCALLQNKVKLRQWGAWGIVVFLC